MNYNKLNKALESSNLTITELCKKLGIDRKTFYNNTQNNTMKIETLEKICTILNLEIWQFFYEEKPFKEQETATNAELLKCYKRIAELQAELMEARDLKNFIGKK